MNTPQHVTFRGRQKKWCRQCFSHRCYVTHHYMNTIWTVHMWARFAISFQKEIKWTKNSAFPSVEVKKNDTFLMQPSLNHAGFDCLQNLGTKKKRLENEETFNWWTQAGVLYVLYFLFEPMSSSYFCWITVYYYAIPYYHVLLQNWNLMFCFTSALVGIGIGIWQWGCPFVSGAPCHPRKAETPGTEVKETCRKVVQTEPRFIAPATRWQDIAEYGI